jgi:hypothetical protein
MELFSQDKFEFGMVGGGQAAGVGNLGDLGGIR